jgi:hypothetical protein
MTHWVQSEHFDIWTDEDMAQITGFDERAVGHWVKIPMGKGFRERRMHAIELIQKAIEAGHQSGQII